VLRRIFGLKRGQGARDWRRLYNKELHNLYTSSNIIRVNKSERMRSVGHITRMEERDKKCIQYFGWKPEGKRLLERPRCRQEDNIKTDPREIVWEGVD
jgi:hypothetical protein